MTITICGSMYFFEYILELKNKLEGLGHEVLIPSDEGKSFDYQKMTAEEQERVKKGFIDLHLDKIKKAEAILVVNMEKHGVDNYIGPNTFLEMGFAYALQKKIFLYNPVPNQPNTTEILGLKPLVLYQDLSLIKLRS